MGRGGLPSWPAQVAGGLRAHSGGAEEGPARRAGARAAVRRLSLRARQRGLPHPRHQRHHRAADRLCDRTRRLARHRECACADHVGHGAAAGRRDLRRGGVFALHGKLGRARGRGAARSEVLPVRRRRDRHVGALRAVARHDQADSVLRHADLCAASRPGRGRGGDRSARLPPQGAVLLGRAGRLHPVGAREDRGAVRRAGDRTQGQWPR